MIDGDAVSSACRPIIGTLFADHDTLLYVMDRLRRLVAGDDTKQEDYPRVPMPLAAISGAMMHPFTATRRRHRPHSAASAGTQIPRPVWLSTAKSNICFIVRRLWSGNPKSASCRVIRRGRFLQLPDRGDPERPTITWRHRRVIADMP